MASKGTASKSPIPSRNARSIRPQSDVYTTTPRMGNENRMDRRRSAESQEVQPPVPLRTFSRTLAGRTSFPRRFSQQRPTGDGVPQPSDSTQDASTPKVSKAPVPKHTEEPAKLQLNAHVHVPYPPDGPGNGAPVFDLVIVYLFHGDNADSHQTFFDNPITKEATRQLAQDDRLEITPRSHTSDGLESDTPVPIVQVEAPKISTSEPPRASNWLNHRRMLPKILPSIRTICVGYDLKKGLKDDLSDIIDFKQASVDLHSKLDQERKGCPDRPAIFIGHRFGARIIQESAASEAGINHPIFASKVCAGIILTDTPPGLCIDSMMRERSILMHNLPLAERERALALGFSSPKNPDFQLLAAKIVEFFEIFQLMDAVRRADFKKVQAMMLNGIDVNQRKDANSRTALHVACGTSQSRRDDIAWLVDKGNADVALADGSGRTALHFAVAIKPPDEGIVRVLLESGADPRATDADGHTPLSLTTSEEIRRLLTNPPPINGPSTEVGSVNTPRFPHSPSAVRACRLYEMVATEIYLTRENKTVTDSYLSRRFSVDQAIYGQPSLQTLLENFRADYNNRVMCRWYHLPANNMVWVDDLFRNRFQMHPVVWSEQFRDSKWPHGRCINPHAARFLAETGESVLAVCMPYVSYETNDGQKAYSKLVRGQLQSDGERPDPEGSIVPMSVWQYKQSQKWMFEPGVKDSSSLFIPLESRRSSFDGTPTGSHSGDGNLHATSNASEASEYGWFQPHNAAVFANDSDSGSEGDISKTGHRVTTGTQTARSGKDKLLLEAYLRRRPPLHIRRTLDQYYYYMLEDTRVRDDDQVVGRWAKSQKHETHNILMVDQLWLWVIKGKGDQPDKVITCFPDREGIASGSLDHLQRNVLERKLRKNRPFENTAMLVSRIIATCSDVFTWSQEGELVRFLHFFEATVGKVGDQETKLLKQFKTQSLKLHTLNKRRRNYSKEKDQLLKELLDIGPQTELLEEVKDILDEIKIILRVLQEQQRVLEVPDTYVAFFENPEPDKKRSRRERKAAKGSYTRDPCHEPLKIIRQAIGAFQRMEKQTKEVYDGLNHLLDLQQKQATIWEARSTREGAKATARQGNVMVVFTTVTIIFLPLSFMASFFALDVDEFPQNAQGQTNWSLRRVCTLLFCISFGLIIPFITLAFLAGRIHGNYFWAKYNWLFPMIIGVVQLVSHLPGKNLKDSCEKKIRHLSKHKRQYNETTAPIADVKPEVRPRSVYSDGLPPSELSDDSGSDFGSEKSGGHATPRKHYHGDLPGDMV